MVHYGPLSVPNLTLSSLCYKGLKSVFLLDGSTSICQMSTQVLHYIDTDPLDSVYFCKTMTALRSGP